MKESIVDTLVKSGMDRKQASAVCDVVNATVLDNTGLGWLSRSLLFGSLVWAAAIVSAFTGCIALVKGLAVAASEGVQDILGTTQAFFAELVDGPSATMYLIGSLVFVYLLGALVSLRLLHAAMSVEDSNTFPPGLRARRFSVFIPYNPFPFKRLASYRKELGIRLTFMEEKQSELVLRHRCSKRIIDQAIVSILLVALGLLLLLVRHILVLIETVSERLMPASTSCAVAGCGSEGLGQAARASSAESRAPAQRYGSAVSGACRRVARSSTEAGPAVGRAPLADGPRNSGWLSARSGNRAGNGLTPPVTRAWPTSGSKRSVRTGSGRRGPSFSSYTTLGHCPSPVARTLGVAGSECPKMGLSTLDAPDGEISSNPSSLGSLCVSSIRNCTASMSAPTGSPRPPGDLSRLRHRRRHRGATETGGVVAVRILGMPHWQAAVAHNIASICAHPVRGDNSGFAQIAIRWHHCPQVRPHLAPKPTAQDSARRPAPITRIPGEGAGPGIQDLSSGEDSATINANQGGV